MFITKLTELSKKLLKESFQFKVLSTEFKSLRKKARKSLKSELKYQEKFKLKELYQKLLKLRKLFKLTDHSQFQLKFQSQLTELSRSLLQLRDKLRRLCKWPKKLKRLSKSDLNKLESKKLSKLLKSQLLEKSSEKLRRSFLTSTRLLRKLKLSEKRLFQSTPLFNKSSKFQPLSKRLCLLPMRFQEFMKLRELMRESLLFLKLSNYQLTCQLLLKSTKLLKLLKKELSKSQSFNKNLFKFL